MFCEFYDGKKLPCWIKSRSFRDHHIDNFHQMIQFGSIGLNDKLISDIGPGKKTWRQEVFLESSDPSENTFVKSKITIHGWNSCWENWVKNLCVWCAWIWLNQTTLCERFGCQIFQPQTPKGLFFWGVFGAQISEPLEDSHCPQLTILPWNWASW